MDYYTDEFAVSLCMNRQKLQDTEETQMKVKEELVHAISQQVVASLKSH